MNLQEKMRDSIRYIQEHIRESISIPQLAKRCFYSEPYFSEQFHSYFGMSPGSYIRKQRIYLAAEELRKRKSNISFVAKEYGYADVHSFSKAFRKELGISPRGFLHSAKRLPYLLTRSSLQGEPLNVYWQKSDALCVTGTLFPPRNKEDIQLLREIADGLLAAAPKNLGAHDPGELLMWWNDEEYRQVYFWGSIEKEIWTETNEHPCKLLIPPGRHLVFEIGCEENPEKMAEKMNAVADYAYNEWCLVNSRQVNPLGYVYQRYFDHKACLYVPVLDEEENPLKCEKQSKTAEWTSYINAHITEKLSAESVASHFGYSTQHFRDVFRLYYEMPVGTYIRRMRLAFAAQELKKNCDIEEVILKYGFSSPEVLRQSFRREFKVSMKDFDSEKLQVISLNQQYSRQKDIFHTQIEYREAFAICGQLLLEGRRKKDISVQAAGIFSGSSAEKYAIWYPPAGITEINYLIGEKFDQGSENGLENRDGCKTAFLSGGKYQVFFTEEDSDMGKLPEVFRSLCRHAFYGWINENWKQVDFDRITFLQYKGGKLYAYVPIY